MKLFYFLLIGLLAGWLAGQIMRGRGFGFVGNLVVGVVGAVLGGVIFDVVGLAAFGLAGKLILSVVGAVVLLFLIGLIK